MIVNTFQYRVIAVHFVHFAVIVATVLVAIFAPLVMRLESSSLSELQRMEVSNQLLGLGSQILPTLWFLFGLFVIHSVVVSQRIAGPIYRIRQALTSVAEGDLTARFTLRKHDYLMKDAEVVNVMIEALGKRVRELEERYDRADNALTGLKDSLLDISGDARGQLDKLGAELKGAKKVLDEFTTVGREERESRELSPELV